MQSLQGCAGALSGEEVAFQTIMIVNLIPEPH